MSFSTPNIFTGGTKAKALEVNENFEAVKLQLNKHTDNIAEVKDIAKNTDDYARQTLKEELKTFIDTKKPKCCINSGNLDSTTNMEDVLHIVDTHNVGFKVGGDYPKLVGTNVDGELIGCETLESFDMSEYPNGLYNLALTSVSVETVGKIFKQKASPIIEFTSPFVQPVLSADGTIGANAFAVHCTTPYLASKMFNIFDNNVNTNFSSAGLNIPWTFYNPKPIRIGAIDITNHSTSAPNAITEGQILGSDDGITYTLVKSFTNTIAQPAATWTIDLSASRKAYKYHQLLPTKTAGTSTEFPCIVEMKITAVNVEENVKEGDLWLDTGASPCRLYRYETDAWKLYKGIPFGSATITNGSITAVETFPFNQNGYDVNFASNVWTGAFPDYKKAVNKAWAVEHTATQFGWVRPYCNVASELTYLKVNEVLVVSSAAYSGGTLSFGAMAPVKKGDAYKMIGGDVAAGALLFIPAKGEN